MCLLSVVVFVILFWGGLLYSPGTETIVEIQQFLYVFVLLPCSFHISLLLIDYV